MSDDRRTGDWVSTGVLADRSGTPATVGRFFGEPDRTVPDPVYRPAVPMRLGSLARAVAAENTEQCRQWREEAAQRSASSKAVAETTRAVLFFEVAAFGIRVPVIGLEALAGRKRLGRTMNRRLTAWTKGVTAEALKNVSERRGSALTLVNASYTSQVDPETGALASRRGDRLHCVSGVVWQADHAAAINILNSRHRPAHPTPAGEADLAGTGRSPPDQTADPGLQPPTSGGERNIQSAQP